MGAVLSIARPRGRAPLQDGRRAFDLFPSSCPRGAAWMFAIGFTDGRVKMGVATRPGPSVQHYWAAVDGRIAWAHVFGRVAWARRSGGCAAQTLALSKAGAVATRIDKSQFFRGLSKAQALHCVRAAIAEAAQMTPREALCSAIRVLGSQTAVAAAAGGDVETGHVYYWLNKAPEVPPRYCPGIERATREKGETVFCEQLCPSTDWGLVRAEAGPDPTLSEAAQA